MFGPDEFQELSGVSRETLARLKLFVDLLQDWNSRLNLVSAASLEDVWQRHVWDSTQLAALIPKSAKSLADLGSGAGFPGLVLALVLAERGEFRTVLFEATAKKCHFLAEAAERTGARVEIQQRADGGRAAEAVRRGDGEGVRAAQPAAPLCTEICRFADGLPVPEGTICWGRIDRSP